MIQMCSHAANVEFTIVITQKRKLRIFQLLNFKKHN